MRTRRIVPVSVALSLVAVACAGNGDDDSVASTTTRPDVAATVAESPVTESPVTAPSITEPSTSSSAPTESPAENAVSTEPVATDAPVPDTTPEPEAVPTYDFSEVGPIVDEFVADRGLDGAGLVVVERDDGVVHEQYWGEFDADRISLIASSSKMISAGVLLHLDDEGMLDIDAPVADVAEWGSGNPQITPAQLISNSSGLVGLLPDPTFAPYLCQYIADGTLQDCAASIFTTPADDDDVIAPDTEFRYGGAQWTVAGAVAEVASGKPFATLVDEIFAEPCGLDSLGFNNHFVQMGSGFDYPVEFAGDPGTLVATANPNPEGGGYITAPDYAQLLLMQLRDGMCGDVQVLSPDALDTMHADRISPTYAGRAGAFATPGTGYGMGWWVDLETGRISDGGAYGSVPWLDLDDGYGAYLVIEADSATGNQLADLLEEVVHTAVTS